MISFASYAFNKSHAAAYGVVAMQTAWLKRHYPVQFMAAMLNSVYGNTGKIAGYVQYCRGKGIAVLPPDVNRSRWKFTVDTETAPNSPVSPGATASAGAQGTPAILFGLGAVKSVGENAVNAIRREREARGPFRDIFDFCRRVDPTECSKRVVDSLIKAGAFDRLPAPTGCRPANRPQMLAVYEQAMEANQSSRKKNVSGQVSLFDLADSGMFGEESQALLSSRIALPDLPDCPPRMKLQMEKEAAGVYMSGHPLDEYRDVLSRMTLTAAQIAGADDPENEEAREELDGRSVELGGILTEVKGKATKKGDYMAFVTLEDMTGQIECLVFPRVYEKYQTCLQEDAAVAVSGKISVREEEAPKILADRITPLEDWKPAQTGAPAGAQAQPAHKLFLRLNRADMDRTTALLALEAGDIPVYMHIPAEKITLLCPRTAWCSGSEACLRRLRETLGAENVVLK
jgi:DNA polymerase-3 subunit alpha